MRHSLSTNLELPVPVDFVWFPAWNSHSYRSMMSNEDIRDIWTHGLGGVSRTIGGGIARGFGAIVLGLFEGVR